MLTHSVGDPRRFGRRIRLSAVALVAVAALAIFSLPADAGLIFNSVRLDGYVRNSGGDGPVAGVEQHFTNDDFPPPNTVHPLPAINSLPPQLSAPINLRMAYDHANSAPMDGGPHFARDLLTITSAVGQLFANDFDDFVATPIEFETFLYLEELAANEQLTLQGVRIESGHLPPFPPATMTEISNNRGSMDDPIRVQLKLAASQFNFPSILKIHFFYDTDGFVIPEPATSVLLLGGLLGMVAMRRRSR